MKKSVSLIPILIAAMLIFYACRHEILFPVDNGGNNNGGASQSSCSPDSVYFVNDIQPILNSNCTMSGCHDAASHAEGINLTTYTGVMKEVKAGSSSTSSLYKVIIKTNGDRMPPPPMPAMPADQIAKLKKWIDQGAKNNSCDKCDTTDFKFSTAIQPIIDAKCKGCHNAANAGGGIDLSSYTTIKASAGSGKLYGSITWASGFSQMPQNGSKLPDCEIIQIKKWIDNGSPDN
ncbi:MAG: hypothetical protein JNL23_04595 [Chitinophagaceae bacterium]|nr:hypothetical protein [Chitinophagaceae bacterium]